MVGLEVEQKMGYDFHVFIKKLIASIFNKLRKQFRR